MRKSDNLSDPGSCLNRARDDELIFVLLGRDKAAPVAVMAWVEERIRSCKNQRTDATILDAQEWIEAALAEQQNGRTT